MSECDIIHCHRRCQVGFQVFCVAYFELDRPALKEDRGNDYNKYGDTLVAVNHQEALPTSHLVHKLCFTYAIFGVHFLNIGTATICVCGQSVQQEEKQMKLVAVCLFRVMNETVTKRRKYKNLLKCGDSCAGQNGNGVKMSLFNCMVAQLWFEEMEHC
jgi:hypothetical protein